MTATAVAVDVLALGEWGEVQRPGLHLETEDDHRLAESLSAGSRRLIVEDIRAGIRIRSKSWVGVVRFSTFEVRVTPKYAGGNLGVLRMLALTKGLDALRREQALRSLDTTGADLLDLVGLLLAESAGVLARDGLLQDYVAREDTLSVVRGRLLPLEQVTRHSGRVDLLECRYDEFEADIDENRLVAAALERVGRHVRHPLVRGRVNRVRTVFEDACDASRLDPAWLEPGVEYHRRNQHYQQAHLLARLVLGQRGVRDVYSPGEATSFAFLFDMNRLFEDFVTWLIRARLRRTEAVVRSQASDRLVFRDAETGLPYSAVRPDVVIDWRDRESIERRLPVDAKYKLYGGTGKPSIDQGDLYQLFLYAYALTTPESGGPAAAYILFPSEGERRLSVRVDDHAGRSGAIIHARGLDLVRILRALERGEKVRAPALDEIASMVSRHRRSNEAREWRIEAELPAGPSIQTLPVARE